ncbi:MAG: hypothetical protein AAGH65_12440 [Pseudomonadota bacterium]
MKPIRLSIVLLTLILVTNALAQPRILFVRGADRSGGFLEANNDQQRTEQLSDIFNSATNNGNHGWGQLRQSLENVGFIVEQITEQAENDAGPSNGLPIAFESLNLTSYSILVMASNNARYPVASVDAVELFIRSGGSALFISDANFGSDWSDAPSSDQDFLDRFGLIMNQDQGTYVLRRSEGDFGLPDHPVLDGIQAFDGEGVSPIDTQNNGEVLVAAKNATRINQPPFGNNNQGASRPVLSTDGALVILEAGAGRIAGHFDRNTFFNTNGAGTDITRFDNRQYALNLFAWLANSNRLFADGFE